MTKIRRAPTDARHCQRTAQRSSDTVRIFAATLSNEVDALYQFESSFLHIELSGADADYSEMSVFED